MVTDFFDPYNGGVEIHVGTVARALAARGHEVGVATLPTGPHQPPRSDDGPVTVLRVEHLMARLGRGFTDTARPWAPPFPDPLAMVGLRKVVRSFAPDVIHGHDWLSRSVLPRLVSGAVPIVTSLHYYTRTCAKKTLWRNGERCAGPGLGRCLRCAGRHYGAAKGVVVTIGLRAGAALEDRRSGRYLSVSAATADGNDLTGHPNSVVVANPLAPNAAMGDRGGGDSDGADQGGADRVGGDRDEADSGGTGPAVPPAGVPDGPFLLFVGDLRPEKGIRVLFAAVDRLRQRGFTTPLVVVGQRTTADLDVPADTIETGQIDHDTVQELWRRATIGVVPSLWPEPFGLVAIEAMAAGCPLIASAVGGLTEILADDRGVLVPPGDPDSLASAIAELVDDGARRQGLADRASRSLGRYGLDQIVDSIEAEYRLAIDRTAKV